MRKNVAAVVVAASAMSSTVVASKPRSRRRQRRRVSRGASAPSCARGVSRVRPRRHVARRLRTAAGGMEHAVGAQVRGIGIVVRNCRARGRLGWCRGRRCDRFMYEVFACWPATRRSCAQEDGCRHGEEHERTAPGRRRVRAEKRTATLRAPLISDRSTPFSTRVRPRRP